jgi:uracil phosphoribosyltransferase
VSKYLETKTMNVVTPLGEAVCEVICEEVILVPILRAGISMLGAFQRVLPQSKTGFVWAHRDHEANASIDKYKFPKNEDLGLRNRTVIILDTMLATAGTVNKCADLIEQYHPKQILCASILSTQTGIKNISDSIAYVVTASISDGLDENAYIYPGVGDSGDRLYG